MTERRTGQDRRTLPLVPEPLERRGERRAGDRRESLRRTTWLELHAPERECERVQGDLGLYGASFLTASPPRGDAVVVSGRVPGLESGFAINARIVGREVHGSKTVVHVAFPELAVEVELALAKWLDARPS